MSTANFTGTAALTQAFGGGHRSGFFARARDWFLRPLGLRVSFSGREEQGQADRSRPAADAQSARLQKLFGASAAANQRGGRRRGKKGAHQDEIKQDIASVAHAVVAIHDAMDRQAARHDELLKYLSLLPNAIDRLPADAQAQAETLSAIHRHVAAHAAAQEKFGAVLDRIGRNGEQSERALRAIDQRMESIDLRGRTVGEAMELVCTTTRAGTKAVESLKGQLVGRDSELEKLLRQQNARLTAMLLTALGVSIGAAGLAAAMGYAVLASWHS